MMEKSNRIIYGTPIMEEAAQVKRDFIKAHEKFRLKLYTEADIAFWELVGDFEVLKSDIRDMLNDGVLTSSHPSAHIHPDTMTTTLLELVGSIDKGIAKWRNSM